MDHEQLEWVLAVIERIEMLQLLLQQQKRRQQQLQQAENGQQHEEQQQQQEQPHEQLHEHHHSWQQQHGLWPPQTQTEHHWQVVPFGQHRQHGQLRRDVESAQHNPHREFPQREMTDEDLRSFAQRVTTKCREYFGSDKARSALLEITGAISIIDRGIQRGKYNKVVCTEIGKRFPAKVVQLLEPELQFIAGCITAGHTRGSSAVSSFVQNEAFAVEVREVLLAKTVGFLRGLLWQLMNAAIRWLRTAFSSDEEAWQNACRDVINKLLERLGQWSTCEEIGREFVNIILGRSSMRIVLDENVVWHDQNIDNPENSTFLAQLQEIFPNIQTFRDPDATITYLEQNSMTQITLLTSGQNGEELVMRLAGFPLKFQHVSGVHVYCCNSPRAAHEQWARRFPIVKSIDTKCEAAINRLCVPPPEKKISFMPASQWIASLAESLEFASSDRVIQVLQLSKVHLCIDMFREHRDQGHESRLSPGEIAKMNELFNLDIETMSSGQAIETINLYVSERLKLYSFMNKELNRARRTVRLLRYSTFASGLMRAMSVLAKTRPELIAGTETLYRGLAVEDDTDFMNCTGQTFFFRAFTSTSKSESAARRFMDCEYDKLKQQERPATKVLISIDMSGVSDELTQLETCWDEDFALPLDITAISDFPSEQETLLPIMSLLRGVKVSKVAVESSTWTFWKREKEVHVCAKMVRAAVPVLENYSILALL